MLDDISRTWTEALSEKQIEQLRWLRASKCMVEIEYAPPDPLHGAHEGVVLEIIVDKCAVVKLRGTDKEIPEMFDKAFQAVQALFKYVNQAEDKR